MFSIFYTAYTSGFVNTLGSSLSHWNSELHHYAEPGELFRLGGRKLMAGGAVFESLDKMNWKDILFVLAVIYGLIIGVNFFWELFTDVLEHILARRHPHLLSMVQALYKELSYLGLVAMIFFAVEVAQVLNDHYRLVFEFLHINLFAIMVIYVFMMIFTALVSVAIFWRWGRLERKNSHKVVQNHRKVRKKILRSHWILRLFNPWWRIQMLYHRSSYNYHQVREHFIEQHELYPTFRMNSYLKRCMKSTFIEVSEMHWSILITVISLDLALWIPWTALVTQPHDVDTGYLLTFAQVVSFIVFCTVYWKTSRIWKKIRKNKSILVPPQKAVEERKMHKEREQKRKGKMMKRATQVAEAEIAHIQGGPSPINANFLTSATSVNGSTVGLLGSKDGTTSSAEERKRKHRVDPSKQRDGFDYSSFESEQELTSYGSSGSSSEEGSSHATSSEAELDREEEFDPTRPSYIALDPETMYGALGRVDPAGARKLACRNSSGANKRTNNGKDSGDYWSCDEPCLAIEESETLDSETYDDYDTLDKKKHKQHKSACDKKDGKKKKKKKNRKKKRKTKSADEEHVWREEGEVYVVENYTLSYEDSTDEDNDADHSRKERRHHSHKSSSSPRDPKGATEDMYDMMESADKRKQKTQKRKGKKNCKPVNGKDKAVTPNKKRGRASSLKARKTGHSYPRIPAHAAAGGGGSAAFDSRGRTTSLKDPPRPSEEEEDKKKKERSSTAASLQLASRRSSFGKKQQPNASSYRRGSRRTLPVTTAPLAYSELTTDTASSSIESPFASSGENDQEERGDLLHPWRRNSALSPSTRDSSAALFPPLRKKRNKPELAKHDEAFLWYKRRASYFADAFHSHTGPKSPADRRHTLQQSYMMAKGGTKRSGLQPTRRRKNVASAPDVRITSCGPDSIIVEDEIDSESSYSISVSVSSVSLSEEATSTEGDSYDTSSYATSTEIVSTDDELVSDSEYSGEDAQDDKGKVHHHHHHHHHHHRAHLKEHHYHVTHHHHSHKEEHQHQNDLAWIFSIVWPILRCKLTPKKIYKNLKGYMSSKHRRLFWLGSPSLLLWIIKVILLYQAVQMALVIITAVVSDVNPGFIIITIGIGGFNILALSPAILYNFSIIANVGEFTKTKILDSLKKKHLARERRHKKKLRRLAKKHEASGIKAQTDLHIHYQQHLAEEPDHAHRTSLVDKMSHSIHDMQEAFSHPHLPRKSLNAFFHRHHEPHAEERVRKHHEHHHHHHHGAHFEHEHSLTSSVSDH